MENCDEIERLRGRMSELWDEMEFHRARGDWARFMSARRVWLACGRLQSILYANELMAKPKQASLFDIKAHREHDAGA